MTSSLGENTPVVPVSVLIPTKDEERNISDCIDSASWAGEIIVFDSFSEDSTCRVAISKGARLVQRQFDDFATHKNWALDEIDFKYDWVLILDADERVTEELALEIQNVFLETGKYSCFYIARKNPFRGKWMKHGGWYPDWQARLFKLNTVRYEKRLVHEHMIVTGEKGFLKNPLIHSDYKGIERYIERHNTYSSMEAVEAFTLMEHSKTAKNDTDSIPFLNARRRLKNFAYKTLPARPLFKFFWMYILKMGFLDGRIGLRFCILHAIYEYQIDLKIEELKDPASPLSHKYRKYLT